MIGILETATCNLSAYESIFSKYSMAYKFVNKPVDFDNITSLFIPGVGSYDGAIMQLQEKGTFELAKKWVEENNPTLAVCLGFQLLFLGSTEGSKSGFGLFKERCVKFNEMKTPRMTWAYVDWVDNRQIKPEERYYFAHSYYVPVFEHTTAIANYGVDYTGAILKGRVEGYQFHPEKSLGYGEVLIKNFMDRYEKK
jgi:glutamine amidotransferase